jgi:hypothetical protein
MEKINFVNLQNIFMNNNIENNNMNTSLDLENLYLNINKLDENMLKIMNNKIINPYQCKLNLLHYILKNSSKTNNIILKNKLDIIKFFNTISPLNNVFEMSSFEWSYNYINIDNQNFLLVKNSIIKENINDKFYNDYINLIKKILENSNIISHYEEFNTARFYKSIDIIFTINI